MTSALKRADVLFFIWIVKDFNRLDDIISEKFYCISKCLVYTFTIGELRAYRQILSYPADMIE